MKHLDRLREKTENFLDRDCQNCQKGGFWQFWQSHTRGCRSFFATPRCHHRRSLSP
jgi:hypothetical protein